DDCPDSGSFSVVAARPLRAARSSALYHRTASGENQPAERIYCARRPAWAGSAPGVERRDAGFPVAAVEGLALEALDGIAVEAAQVDVVAIGMRARAGEGVDTANSAEAVRGGHGVEAVRRERLFPR